MPAGIDCPPAAAAKVTPPVVPSQLSPAGIGGLAVEAVVSVPLLVGENEPSNWKVLIANVPPDVVVSIPFTVMVLPAVLVPLVLLNVRLL